jgi:ABC-type branched-subunit amino acid transport system substrate-binding protein
VAFIVLAIASLVLAACSSSKSSNGSSGSKSVNVMLISRIVSPTANQPDVGYIAQAYFDDLNAKGGVNGTHIKLDVCDDQNDQNQAASCARKAVSDKDVAVIAPYEPFSQQVLPVLTAAKIPYIGNTIAETLDGTNDNSFPRDGGVVVAYGALGEAMAQAGCKKIGAFVLSAAPTELGATWLEDGAKAAGATFASVPVSASQPDYTAQVAKLLGEGIDCAVGDTQIADAGKILQEIRQSGKNITYGSLSTGLPQAQLNQLGSAANGSILVGQEHLLSDTGVQGIKDITAALATYQPGKSLADVHGVDSWANCAILTSIMKAISGSITSSSVLAAAKQAKTVDSDGLMASIDYSASSPISSLPRLRNVGYLSWKVTDDVPTLTTPSFANFTP